jgi:phosphopantothenoylcysteine synthetase/decarboxylase
VSHSGPTKDPPHRLLIAACGSVGVLALPQYLMAIRRLEKPIDLRVVLSDNAAHMLPRESVAPFCDMACAPGPFWTGMEMGHIGLSEWPDVLAVMPASCDLLARAAAGFGDKPVALLTVAHPGPVLFFPNMNKYMWDKPGTARNVQRLKDDGHIVVDPLLREAFAAAAGRFELGYVLPDPRATAKILLDELELRAARRAGVAPDTDAG